MKKAFFTFCFMALFIYCKSQCVENMGPDDFNQASFGSVAYTDIVVSKQDVPYIVYSSNNEFILKKFSVNKWQVIDKITNTSDSFWFNQIEISSHDTIFVSFINNQKLYVYKRFGNFWSQLGTPFNYSLNYDFCFKLDKQNVPYLAITDFSANNKLSVLKWNGTNWSNVGGQGISSSTVSCKSLAFDTLNNPVIAYKDLTGVYAKRFNGTSWNLLGTNIPVFGSSPWLQIKLNINKQNKMYFVFDHPIGVMMEFNGASWNWVGGFFSNGNASHFNMDFNSLGHPVVGFSEGQTASVWKAVVKTFDGTDWNYTGTPTNVSIGNPNYTSMVLDKNLVPYLIFSDAAYTNKAIVKKLNSNSWDLIGDVGFSDGAVSYGIQGQYPTASMATSKNGTTYIAYADEGSGSKTQVKKWDGTNWTVLGNAPINSTVTIRNQLVIDTSGTPYLLYEDQLTFPAVVKFNGSSWVSVGSANFANSMYSTMAINPVTNRPYVVFSDNSNGNRASVVMFNGSSWVNVGIPAFSNEQIDFTSITFDASGYPCVAFRDKLSTGFIGVMKFDGLNWNYLSSPFYIFGIVNDLNLKINALGEIYLAYQSGSTFVSKYNGSVWQSIGGNAPYSSSGNFDMALDKNGMPLLAFSQTSGGTGIAVLQYDGTKWNLPIKSAFSASDITNPLITADTLGNIYVAYASNRLFAKRIVPGPAVSISASADTLCVGQNVTLIASGSANYSWNFGSTNNVINVTPSVTTVYSVQAQTAGCISYASKNIVVNSCVGIMEYPSSNIITIYPNPTTVILNVIISENDLHDARIKLINCLGQSVLEQDYNSQIDVSNLENGIYTLILKDDNHQLGQKRIIISK